MTNQQIIAVANRWQDAGYVRPFICGNYRRHAVLRPTEYQGYVILACSDCDFRQALTAELIEVMTCLPDDPKRQRES